MSVIDKKPFINTLLESLSAQETETLQGLVNGSGDGPVFRSLLPHSSALLTNSDKGIKEVELEVSATRAQGNYHGYLVFNNTYCVLIAYSGEKNQQLTLIDMTKNSNGIWNAAVLPCELSITELRSELFDVSGGGGSTEVALKKYTVQASDFTVENNRFYATDEFFALLTSKEYYLECDTTLLGGDGDVLYLYPSITISENLLVYAASFSIDIDVNFSSGLIVHLNTKEVTFADNTFNQVVANPADADPADTPLTGVKIGDLNYSIPSGGGGSIYGYVIVLRCTISGTDKNANLYFISDTAITSLSDLTAKIFNAELDRLGRFIPVNGIEQTVDSKLCVPYGVYAQTNTTLYVRWNALAENSTTETKVTGIIIYQIF